MNFLHKKNYITLIYAIVLSIIFFSIYLGFRHSIYNQDYHHSFFILSMFIDFDNDFKLFKDIFLQYGPGQIIFLKFANYFIDINVVSVSQIINIIYAINFLLLFLIFKKVSNIETSLILIILIFLIHPYSVLPWPDYFSGISLSLFFFYFLKENSKYNLFLSAIFLFLAIFFRSTYILNIIFSIFIYFLLFEFYKKKNILKNLFNIFILIISIFFITLAYFDSLFDWFNQSILFITSYAEETKHLGLHQKITDYFGNYGFIILKIFYYALNSALKLFNIFNPENIIFIFFIILNFLYLYRIIKTKLNISYQEKKIVFISLLGLSGFVQSLMLMEVFRNINATIGIFIAGLYFLKNTNCDLYIKKNSKKILILIIFYGLFLFEKFPTIEYKNNNFVSLNNPYFKNKKLSLETKNYYDALNNFICNKENIIVTNVSWDYALPYICEGQSLKNKNSIALRFLKRIKKEEFERIFINLNLKQNEFLFTDQEIKDPKLKLIKIFKTPLKPKEWYRDIKVYSLSQ